MSTFKASAVTVSVALSLVLAGNRLVRADEKMPEPDEKLLRQAKVGTDNATEDLRSIPGVKDVALEPDGEYSNFQLKLEANADPSEEIMKLAINRHWTVREIMRRRPTLEDVFVELTHSDS